MPLRRAVFLDRDGTLIEDRGHIGDPSQAEFFPGTFAALRRLGREFLLFIVTNQRGVAEGALGAEDVDRVNAHVVSRLAAAGVQIAEVYVCPHRREDGCSCIKPKPHFLARAAKEHGVDLTRSFVVGDHPHDVELARNAGACGVYILTGHGPRHAGELPPNTVVTAGIGGAVDRIFGFAAHGGPAGLAEAIRHGGEALRRGWLVAFPTETVYGLGANVFDERAIARVFETKMRPRFDPLIVHVASTAQMESLVREYPDSARALARRFWPGPLTMVLPKTNAVPGIVTAGLASVAVRMPAHELALALILEAGVPVAAPSANRFGNVSPTTAAHVTEHLDVDVIIDGGPCSVGVESTVVSFADGAPALLRPGGVSVEEVEAVVGPVLTSPRADARPLAPGMLPRHYAPGTPLVLMPETEPLPGEKRVGLLRFTPAQRADGATAVETLSVRGDLHEAAANLFDALRRLDSLGLDRLVARPVPETGLGRAIMDRLRRAAHATAP